MIYSTINKNCIYDFTGNPGAIIDYTIEKEGSVIYTGRAVINPNGHAVIAVNRLCADWLSNKLYNVAYTQVQETEGFGIFNLVSEGVTLEQYAFLYAADFDFNGYDKIMSDPVNGHADRRMFVFYSRFSETATPAEEEVLPAHPIIRPDRETMRFAYASGTQTLNVTASVPYTAIASEPWLSVSPQQGQTGTMTFMVGVQANAGMEREAYITFTGDGVEARVKIIQAHTTLIWIDPTNVTFALNGNSRQITVNSLLGFTIGAHPSYLTFNPTAGAPGQQTVTVTCAANAGTQTREGSVNFISGDDVAALIYTQPGHYISAAPSSLEFPSEGGSRTIAVESTDSWTASSIQSFLTMSPQQGNIGVTMVTITCAANSGATRGGGITLTNAAGAQCTISHEQEAFYTANKVFYTSIYGSTSLPHNTTGWTNADGESITIVKNTYVDGRGCFEFSDDIANVPSYAFSGCTDLVTVTFPENVTSIGANAFYKCNRLTSVNIPDGITIIEGETFRNCTALSAITIPDSVTTIKGSAFLDCRGLTSVNIPDNVTTIAKWAFMDCEALSSPITIPSSLEIIGEGAFEDCTSLSTVTIEDGVRIIGMHAFAGCTALSAITIPASVEIMTQFAFSGCTSLTSITIENSSIGLQAFADCTALSAVTIPACVEEILTDAFAGCTALSSVTIEYGVKEISRAFRDCTSLPAIIIPDSVETLGVYAFSGCTSLSAVTLSSSITVIGQGLFQGCTSLSAVTIPASVESMGQYVFSGCTALSEIYSYPPQQPSLESHTFGYIPSTGTLHYPQGSNYSTWIAALPSGWTAVADL